MNRDTKKYAALLSIFFLATALSCDSGSSNDDKDSKPRYAYVAAGATGNGSSPGNAAGTINEGIQYAADNGRTAVLVTGGTYNVDYDIDTHVQMVAGISVRGGYSTDFSVQDAAANETILADISAADGTETNPKCAVIFSDSSITASTTLEDVTVQGSSSGTYSMAVYISAGAPTIEDCIITGGDGGDSMAVCTSGGSPTIQDCTITGGDSENNSGIYIRGTASPSIQSNTISVAPGISDTSFSGIIIEHSSSPAGTTVINGNTISSGGSTSSTSGTLICIICDTVYNTSITGNEINVTSGQFTCGILIVSGSSPYIYNNTIDGGTASLWSRGINIDNGSPEIRENTINGGISSSVSDGIYCYEGSPDIIDNTIDGGTSSTAYCIRFWDGSPDIQGNIIYATTAAYGFGIHDNDSTNDPASLSGNTVYDCDVLYIDTNDSTSYTDVVGGYFHYYDGTDHYFNWGVTAFGSNSDTP